MGTGQLLDHRRPGPRQREGVDALGAGELFEMCAGVFDGEGVVVPEADSDVQH